MCSLDWETRYAYKMFYLEMSQKDTRIELHKIDYDGRKTEELRVLSKLQQKMCLMW
jgi:hypothetical protein